MLFLVSMGVVCGQISSNTADHSRSISYSNPPEKDPLFVFYQTNGALKTGNLTANPVVPGLYNFEWRKYNPDISGFDAPFNTFTNVASSTVSDLMEGGYQVRIWDGISVDTTMMAWVMLDNFIAETLKDEDNKVHLYNSPCEFLVLSGMVTLDTFIYFDPILHDPLLLINGFKFKWTSDNSELRIYDDTTNLNFNITYQPPFEDTWYILTAIDSLGMVEVDSVLYESKQTKAAFSVEYYDKINEEFDPELTGAWSKETGSQDAKLTVRFLNESKNGASYEWVYLDTLGGIKQNEFTYDLDVSPEFTYETADKYYYPYLVSVSDKDCDDTFRLEEAIFVVPSQLVIPNVFSPNGDGENDFFVFKHQSLSSCRVTIVNRTGRIVYRRKIDDIYAWDGWDGNLHESNRRAPEGQYYFVVEALGFDGIEYSDPNILENWKLNRNNKSPGTGTTQPGGQDPEASAETMYTGWLYLYRNKGIF